MDKDKSFELRTLLHYIPTKELERELEQRKSQHKEEPTYSGFTKTQIRRIIAEGFWVYAVYEGCGYYTCVDDFDTEIETEPEFLLSTGKFVKEIKLVRQVGTRQPWFGGEYDGHPDDMVLVRLDDGNWFRIVHKAVTVNWEDVAEYILLERGSG